MKAKTSKKNKNPWSVVIPSLGKPAFVLDEDGTSMTRFVDTGTEKYFESIRLIDVIRRSYIPYKTVTKCS